MLARLLDTAASLTPAAAARSDIKTSSSQLESVTEEEHTAGLLYPAGNNLWRDPHTAQELPPHSRTSAYDDRGKIDLGPFRNFRVVIAQDALGDRDEPCILFDSEKHGSAAKKSSPAQGSPENNKDVRNSSSNINQKLNTAPHYNTRQRAKTSSVTSAPLASTFHASTLSAHDFSRFSAPRGPPSARNKDADPPRPSALFSARRRNSPLLQPHRDAETTRVSSDASLLNCIFGSNAFTYRGSSTKMHLLPQDAADVGDELDVSALKSSRFRHGGNGGGPTSAFGNSSIPKSGSYTFRESFSNLTNDSRSSHSGDMTVMITRMFSINLQTDAHMSYDPQPPGLTAPLPRETKTPMFAVAITIKLPYVKSPPRGTQPNSNAAQNATSGRNYEFFGASLDSDHRWGSQLLNGRVDSTPSLTNMDDRIDTLVEHWDSITRAMAYIEKIASKVIIGLLEATDTQMRQQMKLHRNPPARHLIVTLPPNSLSESAFIREEAARATKRIYLALSIPRVVTGQAKWGIWREEARWVSRPLSDKDQRFFFPVLMTAFLGNHTEWIQFLGPDWHRRRRFLQHKAQKEAEPTIPNRTVIISADKMTSRRLIYVLSSFLPKQHGAEYSQPSPKEPSLHILSESQSPTLTSTLNRDVPNTSRRYSMMKQPYSKTKGIHRFSTSVPSTSISVLATRASEDHTRPLEQVKSPTLEGSWASPYYPNPQRNTALATVAYAAPEASIPVAHFSHESKRRSNGNSMGGEFDEESSSSMASENLLRNLQGSELTRHSGRSSHEGRPRHARWDSFFSGFWSSGSSNGNSKQASPANHSVMPSTVQNVPRSNPGFGVGEEARRESRVHHTQPPNPRDSATEVYSNLSRRKGTPTSQQDKKDETGEDSVTSPIKISGCHDGVVDVELPLPGFVSLSSSTESQMIAAAQNVRQSAASTDNCGSFQSTISGLCPTNWKEYDGLNINVAGWLKRFHEDFLLQAVSPYDELEADIKRAMSAEPTPANILALMSDDGYPTGGRWYDVCTTLIADVKGRTVKQLRLQRRIASKKPARNNSCYSSVSAQSQAKATIEMDEQFIEEAVVEVEDVFIEAVDRVLARNDHLSKSRQPAGNTGRKQRSASLQSNILLGGDPRRRSEVRHDYLDRVDDMSISEVPRAECSRLVLGALEQVVRSVTAERYSEDERGDDVSLTPNRHYRRGTNNENTLREGIRKWLSDVEESG